MRDRQLSGISVARGMAKGVAVNWDRPSVEIPRYQPADMAAEKKRLSVARNQAGQQLRQLSLQVKREANASEAAVFEAQAMFLDDPSLVKLSEDGIEEGKNAELAWYEASEHFALQLEQLSDEILRTRATDVRDVAQRVFGILTGAQATRALPADAVILATDLTPSETASLDKSHVKAFCTAGGGPTSHTAILAKALGIPAVVGLGDMILEIADGTPMLVDGNRGIIICDPGEGVLAQFDQDRLTDQKKKTEQVQAAQQVAKTLDGHRIEIVSNIGNPEDAYLALKYGAEGIGLLRTEFLFLQRDQAPDEETQFQVYAHILDLMGKRPVVVRTLDIGGDKDVPYYNFGVETNPFLGYRAIRISLDHPDNFKVQLRALLRASPKHDLRIMFPMVASLDEIRLAKKLLAQGRAEVISQNLKIGEIQVGIMVEIPSVALMAEKFAQEVDFFSIGTNDLTQYTLAAERGNTRLTHLSDPCHPAVLREIERVVDAAHQTGIWVGVCGEMAGDVQAIPILLGFGVDELSMAPIQIPPAKQVVRGWSFEQAQVLARQVLDLDDAESVRLAVEKWKSG